MKQFLISTYVYLNGNLLSNSPYFYFVECQTEAEVEPKLIQYLNQNTNGHSLEAVFITEKIV